MTHSSSLKAFSCTLSMAFIGEDPNWNKIKKSYCNRVIICTNKKIRGTASSHGLAVKAEDSRLRGCGFKPPTEETIFPAPLIWIKAWKQKLSGN
jgi:hypothetical protein